MQHYSFISKKKRVSVPKEELHNTLQAKERSWIRGLVDWGLL